MICVLENAASLLPRGGSALPSLFPLVTECMDRVHHISWWSMSTVFWLAFVNAPAFKCQGKWITIRRVPFPTLKGMPLTIKHNQVDVEGWLLGLSSYSQLFDFTVEGHGSKLISGHNSRLLSFSSHKDWTRDTEKELGAQGLIASRETRRKDVDYFVQ